MKDTEDILIWVFIAILYFTVYAIAKEHSRIIKSLDERITNIEMAK